MTSRFIFVAIWYWVHFIFGFCLCFNSNKSFCISNFEYFFISSIPAHRIYVLAFIESTFWFWIESSKKAWKPLICGFARFVLNIFSIRMLYSTFYKYQITRYQSINATDSVHIKCKTFLLCVHLLRFSDVNHIECHFIIGMQLAINVMHVGIAISATSKYPLLAVFVLWLSFGFVGIHKFHFIKP